MFGRIHQQIHMGLGFPCEYLYITDLISLLLHAYSDFIFLLELVLVVGVFLCTYWLYPGYVTCCHTIVHRIPSDDLSYFYKMSSDVFSITLDFYLLFFFVILRKHLSIWDFVFWFCCQGDALFRYFQMHRISIHWRQNSSLTPVVLCTCSLNILRRKNKTRNVLCFLIIWVTTFTDPLCFLVN